MTSSLLPIKDDAYWRQLRIRDSYGWYGGVEEEQEGGGVRSSATRASNVAIVDALVELTLAPAGT